MPSPHPIYPTRVGRGTNLIDASELLEDGECRLLRNFRLTGLGRATTRRAAIARTTGLLDPLAVVPFEHIANVAAVVLDYDDPNNVVKVKTISETGAVVATIGNLAGWATTTRPTVHCAVLNQCVFVVDEERVYGLTIYDPGKLLGNASTLFQPTFDFDADSAFAAARPRTIAEHLNHLWIAGWGIETSDPDRPEYARVSYLGLVADSGGAGDAGAGSAVAGSDNLFDVEDVYPLFPRGQVILFMSSAPGRIILCSQRTSIVGFGTDRESWRFDKLDSQRGVVNGRAGGEADGRCYGWSQLGPWRYFAGGKLDWEFGVKVAPVTDDMDLNTMFFVDAIDEHQARWYYRRRSDTTAGCDRFVAWDYREDAWVFDTLGYRVTCGGYLRPSGLLGPDGNPATLTFSDITARTATGEWVPGDVHDATRTLVYLAPDVAGVAGTYVKRAELLGGASQAFFSGLEPSTTYWVKVQQVRNGSATTALVNSFTTLAEDVVSTPVVSAPGGIGVQDSPTYVVVWQGDPGRWLPRVGLSWYPPQVQVKVHIERQLNGGAWVELDVARKGEFTYFDYAVTVGDLWGYRFRAEDDDGNLSAYSATLSVTPTLQPFQEQANKPTEQLPNDLPLE